MNGKDLVAVVGGVEGSLVTHFPKAQLVHYYEAIKRDRMYNRGYDLQISEYAIMKDGSWDTSRYSLHCIPSAGATRQPSLARFWSTFREIEEEAIGFMKRNRQ
jgi:hypothetical protein